MTTKERLLPFSLHYVFDVILLYLLGLITLESSFMFSLKFLLFCSAGVLPFLVLFVCSKTISIGKLALISPLPIGLSWMLGFGAFYSLPLSLLVAWRAAVNWKNPIKQDMEVILALTATISVLWFLFFPGVSEAILLLPAVQLCFMIVLKTYHRHLLEHNDHPLQIKSYILYTVIALCVLAASYFSFPLLATSFKQLLGSLIYFFLFLLSKPIFFLYSLLPVSESSKQKAEKVTSSWAETPLFSKNAQSPSPNQDWILWMIGIVLLLAILFFLRKSIIDSVQQHIPAHTIQRVNSLMPAVQRKKIRVWNSPSEEARKIYIQFEKRMTKLGLGRRAHESVSEWLYRIEVPISSSNNIIASYNKVRYDSQALHHEELSRFKEATQSLAEQCKRKQKELKKLSKDAK